MGRKKRKCMELFLNFTFDTGMSNHTNKEEVDGQLIVEHTSQRLQLKSKKSKVFSWGSTPAISITT